VREKDVGSRGDASAVNRTTDTRISQKRSRFSRSLARRIWPSAPTTSTARMASRVRPKPRDSLPKTAAQCEAADSHGRGAPEGHRQHACASLVIDEPGGSGAANSGTPGFRINADPAQQTQVQHHGAIVVARGGIEPPTRGFSILRILSPT
jgi:hypothetical protein